ncbi:dihydrodipicolinate synthase family protein [Flagellimonas sp.]|uniref:dihydrodipicolinate synthase family protein n=1 Tax=Flagellimonas sp. TaxID=2058762 RepID=UPI003BAE768B
MSAKLTNELRQALNAGMAIPATPTALTNTLKLDEKRQRALLRYYQNAGAGGLAIGVHTSQFEIREAGLYQPILELGKEELDYFDEKSGKTLFRIAGVLGKTHQAIQEAQLASELNYHAVLLSLSSYKDSSNEELIQHCTRISEIIPIIGFYLQPTVGGRLLDSNFWRDFSNIENVVAIKIAPFNRYHTIDVVRGVAESNRSTEVALYTGNDDNIVADLLTEYAIPVNGKVVKKQIVGGLLGHWAVWTKKAVQLFEEIKSSNQNDQQMLLSKGVGVTDANAAFFDSRNGFKGSIAGIHEVLIRQGLLESNYTINPKEILSPGQKKEIDRIYELYPELNDDLFVAENLDNWLR